MHSSLFFKLFPPPKFMVMKHAGLDINDDAITCLEYAGYPPGAKIHKHSLIDLPASIIEAGEIKDEKALVENLSKLDKELILLLLQNNSIKLGGKLSSAVS